MLDEQARRAIPSTGTISAGLLWSVTGFGRKFAQMSTTVLHWNSFRHQMMINLYCSRREAPTCVQP